MRTPGGGGGDLHLRHGIDRCLIRNFLDKGEAIINNNMSNYSEERRKSIEAQGKFVLFFGIDIQIGIIWGTDMHKCTCPLCCN